MTAAYQPAQGGEGAHGPRTGFGGCSRQGAGGARGGKAHGGFDRSRDRSGAFPARGSQGEGGPNRNARGERAARGPEVAFESLQPTFDLRVTNVETGADTLIKVRDKGADQFAARFKKQVKDRRKWARKNDVSCYRIYDADLPDYALAIDRYDGAWKSEGETCVCVAEYQAPKTVDPARAEARLLDAADIVAATLGISPSCVFLKTRRREKGGGQYTDQRKESHVLYTQEAGNVFEVNMGAYLDTGIFLDHRVTRGLVGDAAEGAHFLNLFSYTGTCTVHAAVGGAKTTATVDLSQTYLSWARRNMELNGCTGEEHRFIRADVLKWLDQACTGKRRWNLIFVDPPTFSNSKAMGEATWSVQRDHVALLTRVNKLLAPGGKAVFSCNLRNFKPDWEALEAAGVHMRDITAQTIPYDFARNPKIHCCYIVEKAEGEPAREE